MTLCGFHVSKQVPLSFPAGFMPLSRTTQTKWHDERSGKLERQRYDRNSRTEPIQHATKKTTEPLEIREHY